MTVIAHRHSSLTRLWCFLLLTVTFVLLWVFCYCLFASEHSSQIWKILSSISAAKHLTEHCAFVCLKHNWDICQDLSILVIWGKYIITISFDSKNLAFHWGCYKKTSSVPTGICLFDKITTHYVLCNHYVLCTTNNWLRLDFLTRSDTAFTAYIKIFTSTIILYNVRGTYFT